MAGLDVTRAIPMESAEEFDHWLRDHGATEPELVIAIFKTSSGKQTVGFAPLLETALCHGWVDSQTKSIDDERYAIRFVPRQAGWNWSERNRATAKRLRRGADDAGRDRGLATRSLTRPPRARAVSRPTQEESPRPSGLWGQGMRCLARSA